MKEISNRMFVKAGMYISPITINRDLVIARAFSPRGYLNKKGGDESAWLPEIIICQASKDAPIKINGRGIIAKSPAPCYALQFNPIWGEKDGKNREIIHRFEKAFIPQEEDEIGDIAINKYSLVGLYENNIIPGEISYSGIDNRDILLRGKKEELENMLILASSYLPSKSYALDFGEHTAQGNKKYNIKISNEDIEKFAKDIVCKIF